MPRYLTIILLLCFSWAAKAQHAYDEIYDERAYRGELEQELIYGDTLLFYRILHQPTDLYGELTTYNFSFTEFSRRGMPYYASSTLVDGIRARFSHRGILRNLGLTEQPRLSAQQAYPAGSTHFSSLQSVPLSAARASLFFSGRGYLGGVRATLHHLMPRGWSLSAYMAARGGNELYVDGVWQEGIDAGIRLSREFSADERLSIVLCSSMSHRGLRTGSTQEAFTLIGDNLYNPTWGYQQGEKRNSRTRRECVPMLIASYRRLLGRQTLFSLTVAGEWGKVNGTSLGWYGTSTPRPDNYRYMPSYFTNSTVAQEVEHVWRSADSRYTQIDWTELYTVNAMAEGEARYALEERINRISRSELYATFHSPLGANTTLRYGVRAGINSSRNYKRMGDLLGADHLTDIDYYLTDDDTYSLNLQNDMRHPNRRVTEGDRFGYDYTLVERYASIFAAFSHYTDRWSIDAYAAIGSHTIHRNGNFEKEIFAGDKSYGKSRNVIFSPYTISANVGYTFSPQHHVALIASLHSQVLDSPSLWLNPQYNNRTIDNPSLEQHITLDASYKYHSAKADITASLFLRNSSSGTNTIRAYDDLSATFCDIVTDDISTLGYGVEIASQIRFSSKWRAAIAFGVGNYIYTDNPMITMYSDTDNTLISHCHSQMQTCHIGGVPHIAGSATITYLDYSGWACSLGVNVAALRYVEPSFTRRSERVARQSATSEEIYREFISQEQLGDAATVDVSVSRWFNIRQSRLSLTLSVKNLLGHKNIIYSGYESSRIRHYRSGAQHIYRPQDNIITYAYPRTLYFVATWRF